MVLEKETKTAFRRMKSLLSLRVAVLAVGWLAFPGAGLAAAGPETATILWRGNSIPVSLAGTHEFKIADVAKALGFEVSIDAATGVLTITGFGHQVNVGAGTTQVPVDQKILPISKPARAIGGALYGPIDFFEKVLFPIVGATGTPSLSLEVAVVHVDPSTQIVIKLSTAARFVPTLTDSGFQVRFPNQKLLTPFPQRRYDDPFVSLVSFTGDAATIEFKEKGLAARAYPLTNPDRVVVEVGRAIAATSPAFPAPAAPGPGLTIVVDPGHGGTETGAIGPGGLQEKDVTLQIAKRLASALPRGLSCRVVLTRDSDSVLSLDDRTSVANHEKADLFLSLHANSSRMPGAHGSETYYLSLEASDKLASEIANQENQPGPEGTGVSSGRRDLDFILWDMAQSAHLKESSELAEAIQAELNALSGTQNRGIKQAPFRVLVGATMPAVLVETAFISNPEEEKRLASATFQQSVADAVAKAVSHFFTHRKAAPAAALPKPSPAP